MNEPKYPIPTPRPEVRALVVSSLTEGSRESYTADPEFTPIRPTPRRIRVMVGEKEASPAVASIATAVVSDRVGRRRADRSVRAPTQGASTITEAPAIASVIARAESGNPDSWSHEGM
jgi:hypothetical protein